ncbi:MAG: cysteine desulfurase family protein, partial [Alphaproteobacteria bacterium]
AAAMLLELPELALSTGSACASGKSGPSHVLLAMGLDPQTVHASSRFGLGRDTTESDIDFTVARLASWRAEAGR